MLCKYYMATNLMKFLKKYSLNIKTTIITFFNVTLYLVKR